MNFSFKNTQKNTIFRIICSTITAVFLTTVVVPQGFAQSVVLSPVSSMPYLPVPGTMVGMTDGFRPALVKGLTIHPENPLLFDFIVNAGDTDLEGEALKAEANKMIKYFLASLTVPEKEMWVNLSPDEPDRIIPNGLGDTEMGRDLLAQDYLLKQLTASLMYPEEELGEKFWERIYERAYEEYGVTDIPVDTFHKVWIVPETATVYEHEESRSAFVTESRLKVMLEEDYLAVDRRGLIHQTQDKGMINHAPTDIIREIILPEIEREVNVGQTFANLRQIYHTMILATWYKLKLKNSLLGQVYVDQNKTKGVDTQDKHINQKIYDQYIQSFKKGVYNYIKEDYDPVTQEIVPRKYFSGGYAGEISQLLKIDSSMVSDDLFDSNSFVFPTLVTELGVKNNTLIKSLSDAAMFKIIQKEASNIGETFEDIQNRIDAKKKRSNEPYFIFVAGGSASGKTSMVSTKLAERFNANILSMDEYYRGLSFMNGAGYDNWDIPEAFDWKLLKYHIKQLKKGEIILKPKYSFKTSAREGYEQFNPSNVIIVEGLYPLHDSIVDEGDYRIFVKVGPLGQLLRRLNRDVVQGRTKQTFKQALNQLLTQVVPTQRKYIDPTAKNADLIFNNDYKAAEEALDLGKFEVQAKVKVDNFNEDSLLTLGARQVSETEQTDTYYTSKDRDTIGKDELLRMREQDGVWSGVYKGPLIPDELRHRASFPFYFDADWLGLIKEDYKELFQVKKKRKVYQHGEVEIRLDNVEALGQFVEVSATDIKEKENVMKVIQELGFSEKKIIKKSYFDLMDPAMIATLNAKEQLLQNFKENDNVALIALKGQMPFSLRFKILKHLSQWFEVTKGEKHAVSFKEMVDRWGDGYLKHRFIKVIEDNQEVDSNLAQQMAASIKGRDEKTFNELLKQLEGLAEENKQLRLPLQVYKYYSGEAQQVLLKLKPNANLDLNGMSLQEYVKKEIVGATFAYDAKPGQLRHIIRGELQKDGALRPILEESLEVYDQKGYEAERYLSSVFNGVHSPSDQDELNLEFDTLTEGDVTLFNKAFDSWQEKVGGESSEYFYSTALNRHIAKEPLKVDANVSKAAEKLGIKWSWDNEGRINYISQSDGILLLQELGATALSPTEYWQVFHEAVQAGDEETIKSLTSKKFVDWLDVHFIEEDGKHFMVEHPKVIKNDDGSVKFIGEKVEMEVPRFRPGWFDPKGNIDEKGMPKSVMPVFSEEETTWKYWDFYTEFAKNGLGAIRGYVISSGTPSWDLGIPHDAKFPVLGLRAVYKELPQPTLDVNVTQTIDQFALRYNNLVSGEINYEEFYDDLDEILAYLDGEFFEKAGAIFTESQEKKMIKVRDNITNILGLMRFIAQSKNDAQAIEQINATSRKLFGVEMAELSLEGLNSFIMSSRARLKEALDNKKPIGFVKGHKNPDTDTVISSLLEAYRNYLINGENVEYIPVVESKYIPAEVEHLLNNSNVSNSILLTNEADYQTAFKSGQARWILMDHNKAPEVQKFVTTIVDHHDVSDVAKKQDVSKTIEIVGSTTALVTQRLFSLGIDISSDLSRILYGATLMDTENRSEPKMTEKDRLIMNSLKTSSGVKSDTDLFQGLMDRLLSTNDAEFLFGRDYKEDWGFGYAVVKVKEVFDKNGSILKEGLFDKLVFHAKENNASKNLPLTIVKVVDYEQDNETVNRERLYLIFNETSTDKFKDTMFDVMSSTLNFSYRKYAEYQHKISRVEDFVEFWGAGDQISRKKIAPLFEPVVAAFNQSFYSPSTGLHVQRNFLKEDDTLHEAARALGFKLSWNEKGWINNITYYDAKRLLDFMGVESLSLREGWLALKDAHDINDEQMKQHLHHPEFVEFLDTIIENNNLVFEHPKVNKTGQGYEYQGEKRRFKVLEGKPGLIHPDDIDLKTGLPRRIRDARTYEDPVSLRYWSPDADVVVPTRGHIFLLGQAALDMKIHPDDAFPNLGIRVVSKEKIEPSVEITQTDEDLKIVIVDEENKRRKLVVDVRNLLQQGVNIDGALKLLILSTDLNEKTRHQLSHEISQAYIDSENAFLKQLEVSIDVDLKNKKAKIIDKGKYEQEHIFTVLGAKRDLEGNKKLSALASWIFDQVTAKDQAMMKEEDIKVKNKVDEIIFGKKEALERVKERWKKGSYLDTYEQSMIGRDAETILNNANRRIFNQQMVEEAKKFFMTNLNRGSYKISILLTHPAFENFRKEHQPRIRKELKSWAEQGDVVMFGTIMENLEDDFVRKTRFKNNSIFFEEFILEKVNSFLKSKEFYNFTIKEWRANDLRMMGFILTYFDRWLENGRLDIDNPEHVKHQIEEHVITALYDVNNPVMRTYAIEIIAQHPDNPYLKFFEAEAREKSSDILKGDGSSFESIIDKLITEERDLFFEDWVRPDINVEFWNHAEWAVRSWLIESGLAHTGVSVESVANEIVKIFHLSNIPPIKGVKIFMKKNLKMRTFDSDEPGEALYYFFNNENTKNIQEEISKEGVLAYLNNHDMWRKPIKLNKGGADERITAIHEAPVDQPVIVLSGDQVINFVPAAISIKELKVNSVVYRRQKGTAVLVDQEGAVWEVQKGFSKASQKLSTKLREIDEKKKKVFREFNESFNSSGTQESDIFFDGLAKIYAEVFVVKGVPDFIEGIKAKKGDFVEKSHKEIKEEFNLHLNTTININTFYLYDQVLNEGLKDRKERQLRLDMTRELLKERVRHTSGQKFSAKSSIRKALYFAEENGLKTKLDQAMGSIDDTVIQEGLKDYGMKAVEGKALKARPETTGGIDFDSSMLNLHIQHDGNGIALPLELQDLDAAMQVPGFEPHILFMAPVNMMEFLGRVDTPPDFPNETGHDGLVARDPMDMKT